MRAPLAATLALLATACLGREVVGQRGEGSEPECIESPPSCSDSEEIPELAPFPEDAFDVPATPCEAVVTMDRLPAQADLALDCADVAVDLAAGETIELRGARLERVRLRLRGGEGATVRLADSTAEGLYVTAEGHVWLEIGPRSDVDGLVFEADPSMEGSVLTIFDADVSHFALRTRARAELRLEGARVAQGVIDVGELVSVEARLHDVRLRADEAVLASTHITEGQHELATARIVDSSFTNSEIYRCGSVRMVSSLVESSFVAACGSPLVLASTALSNSRVHGTLEAWGGDVVKSALSPGPEGALLFSDSTVRYSALCNTRHFTASSGTVLCSSCRPDIPDAIVEQTYVFSPECPSLEAAAAAQEK